MVTHPMLRHHPWLESSRDFRTVISNLSDEVTEVDPIKIAIIDNGIDTALGIFDKKIEVGASFCHSNCSWYTTSGTLNHGTVVAALICQMCPKVKLYICQLDETTSPTGARSITMESAAEAVEWAIDQEVDVICMDWAIEENTEDVDAQNHFEVALSNADGRGIIMISSASDEGANLKKTWPGGSQRYIRIGASTPTGNKASFVHPGNIDFLFPGEGVPLEVNEEVLPMGKIYNGSSFATAIAAGTAGLLLHLDR